MRARLGLLFLLAAVALTVTATARAQTAEPPPGLPPTDDQVNAIAKNMYCPVCENVPLDVCPTLACQQWRDQIREKLVEGWTEEEIHDYFVLQYGDRVLAAPPRTGLNWLIYIGPWVLIAAGVVMVTRLLLRLRPASADKAPLPPATPGVTDESEEYRARLEAELKRRDSNP